MSHTLSLRVVMTRTLRRIALVVCCAMGVGVVPAIPARGQVESPFSLGTVAPLMTHRSLFKVVTGTFERLDQFAYRPPADGCEGKRSEIWSDFDLTYADQKTTSDNTQYIEWGSTGLYGFDTHRSQNTLFGINFGMTLAESKSPTVGGFRERDTLVNGIVSLYGIRYNAGWSLKGTVGYSYNAYKLFLGGDHDHHVGHGLHASTEIAKRFRFGQTILSPYYGFTLIELFEDAPRVLDIGKRTTHRYTQRVGVRLGRDLFLRNHWILYPHLDLAWQHNYDNKAWGVDLGAVRATARPYLDLAVLGGGLNLIVSSSMWAYCRYDVEWAEKYQYHVLTGGFVWTF